MEKECHVEERRLVKGREKRSGEEKVIVTRELKDKGKELTMPIICHPVLEGITRLTPTPRSCT